MYQDPRQTDHDAYTCVLWHGRMGSTASPRSVRYLESLRQYLYQWLREVEAELEIERRKAADREANEPG